MQTWTAAEVNEFARQFHDHQFFPLWLLAASTAMRRSELIGTRWKAIDFDRGLLAIRQVLVKVGGKGEFKGKPPSPPTASERSRSPRAYSSFSETCAESRPRSGSSHRSGTTTTWSSAGPMGTPGTPTTSPRPSAR